jgi:multicomponent Na+:H+ antiporter subunit E
MARAEAATDAAPSAVAPRGALLVRGLGFLALWIVLMGWVPEQLVFGVATAAAAAWASIRLLPSGTLRIRPWALLALVPRFLWQSVVAGVDVARRAFDPSLLPGTVPCGDDEGGVIYHCLDIGQPVLEQLSAEEARLTRAIAPGVAAAANAPSGAMDAADV